MCECVIVLFAPALGFLCICTTTVQYLSMCLGHGEDLTTTPHHCRVPDKEWSFQDGGLYIIKKVGVKILTIIVLYRLS